MAKTTLLLLFRRRSVSERDRACSVGKGGGGSKTTDESLRSALLLAYADALAR